MITQVRNRICEELRILKSNIKKVSKLEAQIEEISYKITVSYGLNTGGGGGIPSSQIENMIIKKNEKQIELEQLQMQIRGYNKAIARLTPLEREIIYEIINGKRLSDYARRKGIYKSTIYKIKNKAIDKIADYLNLI